MQNDKDKGFRSGFIAIIGRPNVGKSTLMNCLLGEKISIISDKPQTTRNRIRGILTLPDAQLVFLDTPGIHKPLHRLNRQMVRYALDAMNDADVTCMLVDVSEKSGKGDAYMLDLAGKAEGTRVLLLNKVDRIKKPDLLPLIERYAKTGFFTEIVPISAAEGDYYAPSTAPFMINYRVEDLKALVAALKAEGCEVLDKVEESEYGKFAWVIDPEGNKVELWEPPPGQ